MTHIRTRFSFLAAFICFLLSGSAVLSAPDLADLAYGSDPRNRLDVYLPDHPQNAPVIVMVHGGGWRFGDKSNPNVWQNKVARWTRQGIVVVAVNYRLMPQADPLEQAQDVAQALSFVQTRADGWGASDQKIVLMGHSAGGHLVAVLSANPTLAHMQGAKPWLGTVVLDSAAMDIPYVMQNTRSRLYSDAFGTDPAFWAAASPLHVLNAGAPPVLLVCSTRRKLPCPEAQKYQAAALKIGVTAKTLPVDHSHRSINAILGLDKVFTEQVERFLTEIGLYAR